MDTGGWITIALLGLLVIGQQIRGLRQDKKLADITRKQDEARDALVSMGWLAPKPAKRKPSSRLTGLPPLVWGLVVGAAGWLVAQSRSHARALAASAGVAMVAALTSPLVLTPSPDDEREASAPPPVIVPQAPPSTAAPTTVPSSPAPPTVSPRSSHTPAPAPSPEPSSTPAPEPITEAQVADDVPPPSPTAPVEPHAPRVETPPPVTPPVPPTTAPKVPPPLGKPGCHWVADVDATPLARVQLVCT